MLGRSRRLYRVDGKGLAALGILDDNDHGVQQRGNEMDCKAGRARVSRRVVFMYVVLLMSWLGENAYLN